MAVQPMCVRLPEDLDAAVRALAESEGISPSEVLRSAVHQRVYSQIPSVDEGYKQARGLAIQFAHEAVNLAAEQIPDSYEEAMEFLQARRRRG